MSVVAVAVGIWVAVAYVVATIWGLACRARDER